MSVHDVIHLPHVCVHGAPEQAGARERRVINGRHVESLAIGPRDPQPLAVSFEQVGEFLESQSQCFFELDGSFVWVGGEATVPWQLDGVIYDLDDSVMYVELKGSCSTEAFDELLMALGRNQRPLVFQLMSHAVFVTDDDLRELARSTE